MKNSTDTRTRLDWPWLALSLSSVLNLFLLGIIAGHFLGNRVRAPRLPVVGTPMSRALVRAEAELDPQDAAAFRAALARDDARYLPAAKRVTAARRALAAQIAAQPFDPHAATQALDAWRTSWDRFMNDFSGPLIDALSSISPEGRRRLIDARRQRLERQQGDDGPVSP